MVQETLENPWSTAAKDYKSFDKITAQFASTLVNESLLEVNGPKIVLDVACGTGVVALELAERLLGREGSLVLATDASLGMAEEALANVKARGLDDLVKVYVMDGQSLNLDDDSIDHVYCQFGLMFFSDPGKGLKEMSRVVKPKSGSVAIASYKFISLIQWTTEAMRMVTKLQSPPSDPLNTLPHMESPFALGDPDTMQKLATEAGLTVVKSIERPLYQSVDPVIMTHLQTNPLFRDLLDVYEIPPENEEEVIDYLVHKLQEASQESNSSQLQVMCLVTVMTKE